MRAEELRIWNFVYRTNKHTKEKTTMQLTASCILDISANGVNSSFVYEPIELTEEMLLKCGFYDKGYEEINQYEENINVFCFGEDDKYKVKFHKEWYGSKKENENVYICFYQSDDYITIIKYLHQLQNLYWCLCGKELEINL